MALTDKQKVVFKKYLNGGDLREWLLLGRRRSENKDMSKNGNTGISELELKALTKAIVPENWDEDQPDDPSSEVEDDTDISSDDIASLKFAEDIKILMISTVEYRLICHFLGVNAPKDIQNAVYKHVTLIGQLSQQCLSSFMSSENYSYAGEIYFDQGQPIPVAKQTWFIKGKEVGFTSTGYRFFEHNSGDKKNNVVAFCWTDGNAGLSGMTLYSESNIKSKQLLERLESFTKQNNPLRGAKLRDVNMSAATFSEVIPTLQHNWENYYFPKHIREMFELEVFGFLKTTERYNKLGISKRGVLLYGPPGTGKTTLGNIICNECPDSTVILITPELIAENNNGKQSIKLLYMLADFVSPAVIFLEDLDLFAEDRDGTQGDVALGGLMNILDGVNQVKNAVTVATTNRLELIEKALSNRPGRFDRVVEIPVMPSNLRQKMFTDRLSGCKVDKDVVQQIVKLSDGWTGAECQEFINSMNLYFINKDQDEKRHVTVEVVNEVAKIIRSLSTTRKPKKSAGFTDGDDD